MIPSTEPAPDQNPPARPTADAIADPVAILYQKLQTSLEKKQSEKTQLAGVQDVASGGEAGRRALMQWLLEHRATLLSPEGDPGQGSGERLGPVLSGVVAGAAYGVLFHGDDPVVADFLQRHFPTGVVPLRSQADMDYTPLQALLAKREFQQADKLTNELLCELAGEVAIQRKWIYFTDVDRFPVVDLQTINALWLAHSEGKFGYSVQRDIWLASGKSWDKFWPKIHWKNGNIWTRYPQEFTWDLTAPRGHLPLSNQLRGVRVIAALFAHPAWAKPD
jgi:GUN4-like